MQRSKSAVCTAVAIVVSTASISNHCKVHHHYACTVIGSAWVSPT